MLLNRLLTLITLCYFSIPLHAQEQVESKHKKHVLIAYYAGSRKMPVSQIKAQQITHLNYAFANIQDGRVIEGNPTVDGKKLKELVDLRTDHPHLKILISVGGWSWSDHFSDAALTPESRKVFAQSAVAFLIRHKLDGIDLDWEYPGQAGEGNIYREEDKTNFTLLLREVRHQLDSLTTRSGAPYLLTIASAANQRYLDHTEMEIAHQYLDYVNIMTYDFFGGWSNLTGHHTALSKWTDKTTNYTQQAVDQHIAAGVPASKIVVGAAFYGRGWTQVNNEETKHLHRTYKGKAFALSYDSLQQLPQHGYTRIWDEKAQAPYLWNDHSKTLITYDDQQSLMEKCHYIKSKGLAGIMFWEYTQDGQGVLLNTLSLELLKP